jgi:hypothetical protein
MTHNPDQGEMVAIPFQERVQPWMIACFGAEISSDMLERADRFTEEALELVQTMPGFTADRAHALVDYVFGRPVGQQAQEVGGVMVTLAALCLASGMDMHEAGETELARIWTKVEQIRAKQAAKPTGSALPIATPAQPTKPAQVEQGDTRRFALIERLGTIADLAVEKPLGGELGDVAYDLLREAAAQISSDRLRLAAQSPAVEPAQVEQGECLARKFHNLYEELAPQFGYETRPDTKGFDPTSPNGKLMIAVCSRLATQSPAAELERERESAMTFKRYWTQERERGEKLDNESRRLRAEKAELERKLAIAEEKLNEIAAMPYAGAPDIAMRRIASEALAQIRNGGGG